MGIEKIGMAIRPLFTRGNAGAKVGQKGKALLNDYTHLVGSESSKSKDFVKMLQKDVECGEMANFNIFTGERIQYPESFLKLWNGRQQLLEDYTKLVGSKNCNPKDYAKILAQDLETGEMANFNILTGEKIKYPESFVKQFKAYQT